MELLNGSVSNKRMITNEMVLTARRHFSDLLERSPAAYLAVMRMRYRGSANYNRIVSPKTDIVIEGFPRCANSFAVRAFRMANDPEGKLRIATHMHSPAQAIMGVRWKIPTLILIRHPDDAVVSFPALAVQLNKHGFATASDRFWENQICYWTRRYAQFYDRLSRIRDRIVIADFAETTSDFGAVMGRLNECFGTAFHSFVHTPDNVNRIFAESRTHLSPSSARNELKERFRDLYHSVGNSSARQIAINTYKAFIHR